MWIVTWCGAETSVFVLATEDEVQDSIARERVRLSEEVQGCETPIDTAQAEVFGKVVFELVSALLRASVSAQVRNLNVCPVLTLSRS